MIKKLSFVSAMETAAVWTIALPIAFAGVTAPVVLDTWLDSIGSSLTKAHPTGTDTPDGKILASFHRWSTDKDYLVLQKGEAETQCNYEDGRAVMAEIFSQKNGEERGEKLAGVYYVSFDIVDPLHIAPNIVNIPKGVLIWVANRPFTALSVDSRQAVTSAANGACERLLQNAERPALTGSKLQEPDPA